MTALYQHLQAQRDTIFSIAKHYHAVNVRVFGSVVRGEENKNSDIDLLVEFLPGASLFDQIGLIEELSSALGRKVDIVSERALNKTIKSQVLSDAKPL